MPGPKMGPRPADFDEEVVRQSPTFMKWMALDNGQKLRYACRDFVKGQGDDEERLMRRIMIARRNNVRDHEALKRARNVTTSSGNKKQRRVATGMTDAQVAKEMDVKAVEATRSYKAWMELEEGKEFVYNQRYIKGKENHDWLLKKNIWRRMRYRRENKMMMERAKGPEGENPAAKGEQGPEAAGGDGNTDKKPEVPLKPDETTEAVVAAAATAAVAAAAVAAVTPTSTTSGSTEMAAAAVVDHALLASAASTAASRPNAVTSNEEYVTKAVVEAAVAAAESYIKEENSTNNTNSTNNISSIAAMAVQDPLALDAAAKLAAASNEPSDDDVVVKSEFDDEDDPSHSANVQEV